MVAAHAITKVSYLLEKHRDAAYARRQLAELLRIVRVASVDAEVIDRAITSAFGAELLPLLRSGV